MRFVVDASFLGGLLMPDEAPADAATRIGRVIREGATAPAHLPIEFANILLVNERRGRIEAAEVQSILSTFDTIGVDVEPMTAAAIADALRLARAHGLTFYDAAYLELALRRGLELATLDKALIRAAAPENVTLAFAGRP